jgi:hypothetical protein
LAGRGDVVGREGSGVAGCAVEGRDSTPWLIGS